MHETCDAQASSKDRKTESASMSLFRAWKAYWMALTAQAQSLVFPPRKQVPTRSATLPSAIFAGTEINQYRNPQPPGLQPEARTDWLGQPAGSAIHTHDQPILQLYMTEEQGQLRQQANSGNAQLRQHYIYIRFDTLFQSAACCQSLPVAQIFRAAMSCMG